MKTIQVNEKKINPNELRYNLAFYLEHNKDQFKFATDDWENLIEGIRNKEWGGSEALYGLSALYKIQIVIHEIKHGRYITHVFNPNSCKVSADNPPISLLYTINDKVATMTGNVEACGHYDLLI